MWLVGRCKLTRIRRCCVLPALLLSASSCAPSVPSPRSAISPSATASTVSPSPTPSPTSTPFGKPLLAAPPLTCPPNRTVGQPERIVATMGNVSLPITAREPVWIESGPELPGPQLFVNSAAGSPGQHAFGGKWIWEVRDNLVGEVHITSGAIAANISILWYPLDGSAPENTLTLDPRHPDHPVETYAGYAEWGFGYAIPGSAGCYWIRAAWPSGTWTVVFAFGSYF